MRACPVTTSTNNCLSPNKCRGLPSPEVVYSSKQLHVSRLACGGCARPTCRSRDLLDLKQHLRRPESLPASTSGLFLRSFAVDLCLPAPHKHHRQRFVYFPEEAPVCSFDDVFFVVFFLFFCHRRCCFKSVLLALPARPLVPRSYFDCLHQTKRLGGVWGGGVPVRRMYVGDKKGRGSSKRETTRRKKINSNEKGGKKLLNRFFFFFFSSCFSVQGTERGIWPRRVLISCFSHRCMHN